MGDGIGRRGSILEGPRLVGVRNRQTFVRGAVETLRLSQFAFLNEGSVGEIGGPYVDATAHRCPIHCDERMEVVLQASPEPPLRPRREARPRLPHYVVETKNACLFLSHAVGEVAHQGRRGSSTAIS